MAFNDILDEAIKQRVDEILSGKEIPDTEYNNTDNLGEVIEKLVIIHIRAWMLEDAMQEAKSDAELADLKRKVDITFKVKRPRLVQAINQIVDDAIANNKSIKEDSVKLYKGVS